MILQENTRLGKYIDKSCNNWYYPGKTYLSNYVVGGRIYKMKSTGIVRKVDELGRVVIPIELRRTLDIEEKDALEIYVDSDKIILRKYEPACVFCGNADEVVNYKNKNVCKECLNAMSSRTV
jgi:transcriptional pleiotropic regulator of transition state genes